MFNIFLVVFIQMFFLTSTVFGLAPQSSFSGSSPLKAVSPARAQYVLSTSPIPISRSPSRRPLEQCSISLNLRQLEEIDASVRNNFMLKGSEVEDVLRFSQGVEEEIRRKSTEGDMDCSASVLKEQQSSWQNLDFIKLMREEIQREVPDFLKDLIMKYIIVRYNTIKKSELGEFLRYDSSKLDKLWLNLTSKGYINLEGEINSQRFGSPMDLDEEFRIDQEKIEAYFLSEFYKVANPFVLQTRLDYEPEKMKQLWRVLLEKRYIDERGEFLVEFDNKDVQRNFLEGTEFKEDKEKIYGLLKSSFVKHRFKRVFLECKLKAQQPASGLPTQRMPEDLWKVEDDCWVRVYDEFFRHQPLIDEQKEADWGAVFQKLTRDVERFKLHILDFCIKAIESLNQGNGFPENPRYIDPEKSASVDGREEKLSFYFNAAIYNHIKGQIERMTANKRLELSGKLGALKEKRKKILIWADRFTRISAFKSFYENYKTSFAEAVQNPADSEIRKRYLRNVLLLISLNNLPFRTRYASIPGSSKNYIYEDDDSISGYSALNIFYDCYRNGWLDEKTDIYDPYFGTGTTAMLSQFLPIQGTVATELCLKPFADFGYSIELERNLREFNAGVIEQFKGLMPRILDNAESLFSDITYGQAYSEKMPQKQEFFRFSQSQGKVFAQNERGGTGQEVAIESKRYRSKEFSFILANPPWGIATTNGCENEIKAFFDFFTDMVNKIFVLLKDQNSGCFARIPDYWARLIEQMQDIDTFEDFLEKFIVERNKDNASNKRNREKNSDKLFEQLKKDPENLGRLERAFYQLKFLFNDDYPLFEPKYVDKNLLRLKKITPLGGSSLFTLPAFYLFIQEEMLKKGKISTEGKKEEQLRDIFDVFYKEYNQYLRSTASLKHYIDLVTEREQVARQHGPKLDITGKGVLPSLIENGAFFVELYSLAVAHIKRLNINSEKKNKCFSK